MQSGSRFAWTARSLLLSGSLIAAFASPGVGQGTNCAPYFTGNFDWTTTLNVQGDGINGNIGASTESVSVGVTAGKASCNTVNETVSSYQNGKLVSKSTTVGTISGPGFVLIEFGRGTDTHTGKPVYRIAVSCPTHNGTITSQSFRPGGGTEVEQITAEPARQGGHEWETYQQLDTSGGQVLKGTTDEPQGASRRSTACGGSNRRDVS
jgi:hypothetical protein